MSSLPLSTTSFYSQHPWPSPPYSDLSVSSYPSLLVSMEQDNYFEGESHLERVQSEDLPLNIEKMYENGDEKLKELISIVFNTVKKVMPSILFSHYSPKNIKNEVSEKSNQLQLQQKKGNVIIEQDWSVISNFLNSNLSQLLTDEQYIKQEIREWKNTWEIAKSLTDNGYAETLPQAKSLITYFIEKHPKYKCKLDRNNYRYGPSCKNFYVYIISKALKYRIREKYNVIDLILIKSKFKINFKTAVARFYDYKKFSYSVKSTDIKNKKFLPEKKAKYLALIQDHREKIDQLRKNWIDSRRVTRRKCKEKSNNIAL